MLWAPFKEISWSLHVDITNSVRIKEWGLANKMFLSTSPRWQDMKKYIHPDLYAKAEKTTQELIVSNPAAENTSGPSLFDDLYIRAPQTGLLSYFDSLGIKDQEDYINNSQNAELARILRGCDAFTRGCPGPPDVHP